MFNDEIQPLNLILDHIWEFLGQLASKWVTPKTWSEFRSTMDDPGRSESDPYALKTGHKMYWGPWAFLVHDVPLQPEARSDHYFAAPETVDDICQPFTEKYGHDLAGDYRDVTRPCIVKFVSTSVCDRVMSPAICYAYSSHWNIGSPIEVNTCFNGEGKAVPKSDIVGFEFDPQSSEKDCSDGQSTELFRSKDDSQNSLYAARRKKFDAIDSRLARREKFDAIDSRLREREIDGD
ncbi:MAG: hypothetical protein IID44_11000 [Planctomycetes bacterium]|nr:hypothetical protein [Planctomycetota bacterium]